MRFEQVVDREILVDEADTAGESMSSLFWGESLESTMAYAIVLAQVAIDRFETVVGLTCDDVGILAFGVSFPADDPLVGETAADVMQCGAARDDGTSRAFMLGENLGDTGIGRVEEFRKIAVGEESPLRVSLLAQSHCAVQESLGGWKSVDAFLDVAGSAEVEQNGNEIGVEDALSMTGGILEADGHPEDLSMNDVIQRAQMLREDFQKHLGAELADAWAADAGELLGDAMSDGVLQGFSQQRGEFLVEEVGLATHGWTSGRGPLFFSGRRNPDEEVR